MVKQGIRIAGIAAALVACGLLAGAAEAREHVMGHSVGFDVNAGAGVLPPEGVVPPATTLPNPVIAALDAGGAAGLALGTYDDQGARLADRYPVWWDQGFVDAQGVHPAYLLDITDESTLVAAQAESYVEVVGAITGAPAPGLAGPAFAQVPRVLFNVDADHLALGSQVNLAAPSADGAMAARAQQAPEPTSPAGSAGVSLPGVPGVDAAALAVADVPGQVLGSPGGSPAGAGGVAAEGAGPVAPQAHLGAVATGALAGAMLLVGFALYHLVNRNNIFENDVRMQVYDVVARNPGVTIQEVARVVGLSHPTARYHLNVLAKNDLVVFLDKGNKMMFFRNRNEFTEQERELVAILRNPEAMRVYETIERSPWVLRKELSERLAISRTSVNWHLRNLKKAGLVAETREQGKGFLFVRHEGRQGLLKVGERLAASAPVAEAAPSPVASQAQGNGQAA